jgi:integral membrane sensor domain MASE1
LRADNIGLFAVVFLAFGAGAVLSWEAFGSETGPSFFYPAAGVTAAAMMLSRRAVWPGIAAAVIAAELLVDTFYGSPLRMAAGFSAANPHRAGCSSFSSSIHPPSRFTGRESRK